MTKLKIWQNRKSDKIENLTKNVTTLKIWKNWKSDKIDNLTKLKIWQKNVTKLKMWQNWKSDKKIEKIKTIDKIENLTKLKIWQSWKTDKIEKVNILCLTCIVIRCYNPQLRRRKRSMSCCVRKRESQTLNEIKWDFSLLQHSVWKSPKMSHLKFFNFGIFRQFLTY